MTQIGVVHLIRKKNGVEPFERFLASYQKFPAGQSHDLVLIFKGFRFGRGLAAYDRILENIPHKRLYLADYGFDLRPYFKAVKCFDYQHFCFFNSFSQILAPDWLAKLHRAVLMKGVGIVAATGSYESFSENSRKREQMLQGMDFVSRLRWRIAHALGAPSLQLVVLRLMAWFLRAVGIWDLRRHFPGFPNPHVRTNAFMASREVLLSVQMWPMLFKLSAFLFESGHRSLTNQIMQLGYRPMIVSSSGQAYEIEQWPQSSIFRQDLQQDLLVADNQTEAYLAARQERRDELSLLAWGDSARPAKIQVGS